MKNISALDGVSVKTLEHGKPSHLSKTSKYKKRHRYLLFSSVKNLMKLLYYSHDKLQATFLKLQKHRVQ